MRQTFLRSDKVESGGRCLGSVNWKEFLADRGTGSLEVQRRGHVLPDIIHLIRKLFSTRPRYPPHYWNTSAVSIIHKKYVNVTLPCRNVFHPACFTLVFEKQKNGVLPHPGPPEFERETWRVFKQSCRLQKDKPSSSLPETLSHNGADRRRKVPPLAGTMLPSRAVGHTRVVNCTCAYVPQSVSFEAKT